MQALAAEVDEVKAKFDESSVAFTELKASFNEDPTSLVPWMNTLFTQVDMGITTFTVSGSGWPHCDLASAFSARDGAEITEASEKLLAAFKKRCDLERGAGSVQIVQRLTPNIFRSGFSTEAITTAVSTMMQTQGIDPENAGGASLDALELVWCVPKNITSSVAVLAEVSLTSP